MSVQELYKSLYGDYMPTGVYSFEFKKTSGSTITEIFFLIPPENISVRESQRGSLIPTLKGGYWSDFGNDFKEISISGNSHFFYAGSPKGESTVIDGYSEFMKLQFMAMRYRDSTLSKNGRVKAPDLTQTKALESFVKKYGSLATEIETVWHNYDSNDHYKVKVDELTIEQSSADPFSINYTIMMTAYQVDDNIPYRKPPEVKKTVEQEIDSAILNLSRQESPENLSYISADIYLLNQRVEKAKEHLENAREEIRKGQKSPQKILSENTVN